MAILGPILRGILSLGISILSLYKIVLIIRILMSWISPDPYNPIVRTLYALTEPVLGLARKYLPFLRIGMIDFSPIAVFIAIQVLEEILRGYYVQLLPRMSSGIF